MEDLLFPCDLFQWVPLLHFCLFFVLGQDPMGNHASVCCPKERGSQWRNGGPDEIFQLEATKFGLVPQTSYPGSYLGAS